MNKNESLESIDVVASNKLERIAIEIELQDTQHIEENIAKCMRLNFDKVIIAVYGINLKKRVTKIVQTNPEMEKWYRQEKIQIELLSSFLN
jgi:hypothetical protein